jgi:hypothetical protein
MRSINVIPLTLLAILVLAVSLACSSTGSPATDSQPAPVESQAPIPATAAPEPGASEATPETPTAPPSALETPTPGSVDETPTGNPTEESTAPPTLDPTPTAAPPIARVGTGVGDSAPEFALQLTQGQQILSSELLATGRPVFMMYFATW